MQYMYIKHILLYVLWLKNKSKIQNNTNIMYMKISSQNLYS